MSAYLRVTTFSSGVPILLPELLVYVPEELSQAILLRRCHQDEISGGTGEL